jgi:hypothetical protein
MIQNRFRMPEHLRRDCVRKLQPIEKSGTFTEILGSLLNEDWTTPNIRELRITHDHRLLGRSLGEVGFKAFRCAEAGLIHNIHEIAAYMSRRLRQIIRRLAPRDRDTLGFARPSPFALAPMW